MRFGNMAPVPLCTLLSDSSTILGHDKDTSIPDESNRGNNDVGIAISHVIQPRSDSIVDCKRHGVADDDACGNHVTAKLRIRRDSISEGSCHGEGVVDGEGELGDYETHPVNMVGHTQTVQEHAERDQEH